MDTFPSDHGSDRFGHVELIDAPEGTHPAGPWWDQLMERACEDCNPNLFAKYQGGKKNKPSSWDITVAHDATCPFLAKMEESGGYGQGL